MYKLLKTLLVVVFLVFFTGSAFAVSLGLDVDSLSFNAEDKADVLGAGNSRTADGKPDASFSLAVSGAQAVKRISLKNETTGKTWSSPRQAQQNFLSLRTAAATYLTLPAGCL